MWNDQMLFSTKFHENQSNGPKAVMGADGYMDMILP
jgi:hypothetical protein